MNIRCILSATLIAVSLSAGCNESSDPPYGAPTTAPGGQKVSQPPAPSIPDVQGINMPAMPPTGMPPAPPSTGPAVTGTVTVDSLTWDLPLGWGQRSGSAMRLATIVAPGDIEIGVTRFPGDVGGMLKNVNRWRGQIGLPEIAEGDLATNVQTVTTTAGTTASLIDLMAATGNSRLLAASIPGNNETWFFKVTADKDKLALVRADFEKLVKSVRPAAGK